MHTDRAAFRWPPGLLIPFLTALAVVGAACGKGGDPVLPDDRTVPLYTHGEITEPAPLLHPDGTLAAWGWARRALMAYDRERVAEDRQDRLKEWDFYAVSSPDLYMETTLADISWAVMATVMVVDFRTGTASTNLDFDLHPERLTLPTDPYGDALYDWYRTRVSFTYEDGTRTLAFDFPGSLIGPRLRGEIRIQDDPGWESLATAMPFGPPDLFFYTNKIVGLPASGYVEVNGRVQRFDPALSYAVLDWGRGVWPEQFAWTWGVAAGVTDGRHVGLNFGYGDEDTSRCTGNAAVVDGVLHKLGKIAWTFDRDNPMEPWRFASEDGRFDMVLEPFYDQSSRIDLGIYFADLAKVHGRLSGHLVLDDGTALAIEDYLGFAEHAFQQW